jgi:hypothetical protein
VSGCDEASLRAALTGGGEVAFAADCAITLSNTIVIATDAILSSGGHSVTLSGNGAVRVFAVAPGVRFTVLNLTLVNGRSAEGAGIHNDGGLVTLMGCTLANHAAVGNNATSTNCVPTPGLGGAVLNRTGLVTAVSCLFSNNAARGGKGGVCFVATCGASASGGALANHQGEVRLTNCLFTANATVGGDGGDFMFGFGGCGGTAAGGAISSVSGTVAMVSVLLSSNVAVGGNTGAGQTGNGGPGGKANGGALAVTGGRLDSMSSRFLGNAARGGAGGRTQPGGPASGGGCYLAAEAASLNDNILAGNQAAAGFGRNDSGPSAPGQGGAVFNAGTLFARRTLFSTNTATGASASSRPVAGPGGSGNGGGLYNAGRSDVWESAFLGHRAQGGGGAVKEGASSPPRFGPGGDGTGGAICNASQMGVVNCTLTGNQSVGGPGATAGFPVPTTGPAGLAYGGALDNGGTAQLLNVTLLANSGAGGALHSSGFTVLTNAIVANSASGDNCSGAITDGGHNLSSDASCAFTASGSLNGTDPLLGPLADHGGPTPTHALLPGSPAIDSGDNATCPSVDQRGEPRPMLSGCDIGAFELRPDVFHLGSLERLEPQIWRLRGIGPANRNLRIEGSSDLRHWTTEASGATQPNGLFMIDLTSGFASRFYRVAAP